MSVHRHGWVAPVALRASLIAAAFLAALLPADRASAGGFYLAPRGTGPLGRGGAMVAGANDPHAVWYNPAGLAWSGDQLMLDATLTLFETTFTRIDGGGNTLRPVRGHHPYLPIPTLGGSFSIDELPEWTFALTLQAPNSALMEWPNEPDAPQRYSLLSLEGSLLATAAAAAAWRPLEELAIGLAAPLLGGALDATGALSACDGVICSFPEDPEYDGVANIALPTVFPLFVLGAVVQPIDALKIGFSVSTPFNLEGSARLRVRPPNAAAFQGAEVVNRSPGCNHENESDPCRQNTRADTQLEFPWVFRLGVEVTPTPGLRVEAAAVYETWSVQDAARIVPRDVWIEGALGGGLEYEVGPLSIPRQTNDTISLRLGGELDIDVVTARLGVSYENGAFSDAYLTPLTIDSDKLIFSGGATVRFSDEVALDAVVGYLWMASRSVRNSAVPQANPIRPPGSEVETVYVGNGDYEMGAPFFGLSVRWRLDAGNLRGPGNEAPEPDTDERPAATEPASSEPAPSTDGSTQDGSTPWYLQGQSTSAQPAVPDDGADDAATEAAPEPPEPEAAPETARERRIRIRRERRQRQRERRQRRRRAR
ncbi:MAG: outer membrane protein transport protein [Sandaracinaceae bacterium]